VHSASSVRLERTFPKLTEAKELLKNCNDAVSTQPSRSEAATGARASEPASPPRIRPYRGHSTFRPVHAGSVKQQTALYSEQPKLNFSAHGPGPRLSRRDPRPNAQSECGRLATRGRSPGGDNGGNRETLACAPFGSAGRERGNIPAVLLGIRNHLSAITFPSAGTWLLGVPSSPRGKLESCRADNVRSK